MSECGNCQGLKLVCENHRDKPWQADIGCDCGGGAPCPVCQQDMAAVGYVVRITQWLEREAAEAPLGVQTLLLNLAQRIADREYLPEDERERAGEFLPPLWTWN